MTLRILVLSPVLVLQALFVVLRASRLPEAAGPRYGTLGVGPELRLLVLGDSSAAGVGVAHQDAALAGRLATTLGARYRVSWRVIAASGATSASILKTLEEALSVHERRSMRIPTSQLNDILLPIIEDYPPPSLKGKYIKIKYITQLPSSSPAFAFFCNLPQYIKDPYKRYLENRMREEFDFTGVPIRLFFRQK